jgi:CubicO group peptidase (beta-lactamase class C family)
VVAVSRDGQLVVNRAYGSADLERRVPLRTESVFDVGSLRKQVIAAGILLLVEDERLSLTSDVRAHFPELPDQGHTITVDHLLTHTSGIRDWTGMLALTGGNADVRSLILRQRALNFPPGEQWSYSNSGYVLLKELVERVSGTSFAAFTRARLFEPLGMARTACHDDLNAVIPNRALPYVQAGNA